MLKIKKKNKEERGNSPCFYRFINSTTYSVLANQVRVIPYILQTIHSHSRFSTFSDMICAEWPLALLR